MNTFPLFGILFSGLAVSFYLNVTDNIALVEDIFITVVLNSSDDKNTRKQHLKIKSYIIHKKRSMYQLTLHLLAMILYTGIVRECTFHDVRSLVPVHPLVVPEAERTVPMVPLNCHWY